jgi:hypothetical protein
MSCSAVQCAILTFHVSGRTHFQHFRGMTQLREPKTCVVSTTHYLYHARSLADISQNNTLDIANHTASFTWRFNDDGDEQQAGTQGSADQLVAGIKDEQVSIRACKMCFANANRKGENGVAIAIGFHQKWLEEQKRKGCTAELVDVFCDALKFCAEKNASLEKLSLRDLQQAVLL